MMAQCLKQAILLHTFGVQAVCRAAMPRIGALSGPRREFYKAFGLPQSLVVPVLNMKGVHCFLRRASE